MRRSPIVVAAAAATLALFAGCRAPTQVTVEVTYRGPSPCLLVPAIAIAVRLSADDAENDLGLGLYTAQTAACTPDGDMGRFGTLVVVPAGGDSRAAIDIVGAVSPEALAACTPANKFAGCIVARRQISFSPHVSLTLPISLDIECKDVACSAHSTCRAKECIPSESSCDGDACGLSSDAGPDARLDSSTDASSDGSTATDASLDGPKEAGGVCSTRLACPGDPQPCSGFCLYDASAMKWSCTATRPPTGFYTTCFGDTDCVQPSPYCCKFDTGGQCTTAPCPPDIHLCEPGCTASCPIKSQTCGPGQFPAPTCTP